MIRFTLRDVFWLTLVVGMGVGWWLDHAQQNRRIRVLEQFRKTSPFMDDSSQMPR